MESNEPLKYKRQSFTLNQLLADNRVVVVLSLLLAFVCWVVATGNSENVERTIENAKIAIDTSGLTVGTRTLVPFFDEGRDKDSYFVNLEVNGPQMYVNKNLTAENFSVSLDMSGVDRPGTYSVNVIVKKKEGVDASVELKNYEPKTVTLYFDEYYSTEVDLVPQLMRNNAEITKKDLVPEGFLAEDPTTTVKTVNVSGAFEQIRKIKRVVARVSVPDMLERTTVFDSTSVELFAETEIASSALKYVTLNAEEEGDTSVPMRVTIAVKKIYELETSIAFARTAPEQYVQQPLPYTITPSKVKIAIEADKTPGETLIVGLLDFSKVNTGRTTFDFPASALADASSENSNITVLSEGVTSFKVVVDASQMRKKTLDTPVNIRDNITFYAVQESFSVAIVTESVSNVVVIAPSTQALEGITAANIRAEIDFSKIEMKEGTMSVKAHLYVNGSENSWCYGEYPIEVNILKRQ
ncbi:MAG: hypothetical protein LBS36_11140 [Oscillospiraceae bacterium]|jgi:YbbR domain-containing protein|nr:hypothetical protein [Oscillospiraceae bacterium]